MWISVYFIKSQYDPVSGNSAKRVHYKVANQPALYWIMRQIDASEDVSYFEIRKNRWGKPMPALGFRGTFKKWRPIK